MRFALTVLCLSLAFSRPVLAQAGGPTAGALRAGITAEPDIFSEASFYQVGSAPDYRWEGAIAGAVVFGAVGAVLGSIGGSDSGGSGSAVLFGVVGAAVGAGIGALVGGAIHKH